MKRRLDCLISLEQSVKNKKRGSEKLPLQKHVELPLIRTLEVFVEEFLIHAHQITLQYTDLLFFLSDN